MNTHVHLGEIVGPAIVERAGDRNLTVLSMTSSKGLVPQASIFKKRIASRDFASYKVVRPNQLVVGIHIDEGALGFSGEDQVGIVSPAYSIWDLVNRESIHIPYLDKFIRSPLAVEYFSSKYRETAERRGKLTQEQFLSLRVPLPDIDKQRRLAAILDKAGALCALRSEALVELDRLAQSIFVEMFGDPVANEKGWPRRRFGDLLAAIESGWSPVCLERSAQPGEWGVLKLGAITNCTFDPTANKALPPNVSPKESVEVKSGDLLFSRKNTYQLVAACALVESTPHRLMMPDLVFRLQVSDETELDKRYLHALLTNPKKRAEVQKLAGGSAGSMPNISKGKLVEILIEVPPISEQRLFSRRLKMVEALKVQLKEGLSFSRAMFGSLEQRAFAGEL